MLEHQGLEAIGILHLLGFWFLSGLRPGRIASAVLIVTGLLEFL